MTSIPRPLGNDNLYRRIDEMRMSVTDREAAKAHLRAGESIADGLCNFLAGVRSGTAYIARQVRTARAALPQH